MNSDNILVSSARSGTNFFLTVYKHMRPDDVVLKEIFRKEGDSLALQREFLGVEESVLVEKLERDPLGLWKDLVAAAREQGRAVLAKIFYYHQPADGPLWRHFRDCSKIVHLIRRNQFDVVLSHQVAQRTGKWQQFDGRDDGAMPEPFHLDPAIVERHVEQQMNRVEWTREFFKGADYHEIFYEDIADSPQSCAVAITRIFGIAGDNPAHIPLKKQKTWGNPDIVTNYADVRHLDVSLF